MRIHVIRHLGSVVETGRKEEVITPESRFESIDTPYLTEETALLWRTPKLFYLKECTLNFIEEEKPKAILILAVN